MPLAQTPYRGLIAEDEPLLAQSLERELAKAWPELSIAAHTADGAQAVEQALLLRPDVLFLDIQMPALSGLEAAARIAEGWQEQNLSEQIDLPLIVFVTAFDDYALQAFDAQAFDYVVKPVRPDRLAKTIQRLQARLRQRQTTGSDFDAVAQQLRHLLLASTPKQPRLTVLQASRTSANGGTTVHLVPIEQVIYFEAADKYIRVLTPDQEFLIRTPLKDLLAQLDPDQFWQVHRKTVVRASAIASAHRDEQFKVMLKLHQRPETLAVSRLYSHLFRAM